jgi:hypothetical protein
MIKTPDISYCPIRQEILRDTFGESDDETILNSVEGLVRHHICVKESVFRRRIEGHYPQMRVVQMVTTFDKIEEFYEGLRQRNWRLFWLNATEAINTACMLASDLRLRNGPYWMHRWNQVCNDPKKSRSATRIWRTGQQESASIPTLRT